MNKEGKQLASCEIVDTTISQLVDSLKDDMEALSKLSELASRIEDNCNPIIEYAKGHIDILQIGDERISFIRMKRCLEYVRTTHRKIRSYSSLQTKAS